MRLSEYLEPQLTITDLEADGVEGVVNAMVRCLHDHGKIDDPDGIRNAVLERESSHTTALGNGVALPHATVAGLDRARIVVAVAPDGVPYGPDGRDDARERLFFMLLSPLDEAGTHIKLLARIVRLVRRPAFVDTLVDAASGSALVEEIEREDALHV